MGAGLMQNIETEITHGTIITMKPCRKNCKRRERQIHTQDGCRSSMVSKNMEVHEANLLYGNLHPIPSESEPQ